MLAETITFTDEEILVFLVVLLAFAALTLTAVVLGCIWAWLAGRGSQRALVGWVIIGSLEGLVLLSAIPGLFSGPNLFPLLPLTVLGLQVGLYLGGRNQARPGQ